MRQRVLGGGRWSLKVLWASCALAGVAAMVWGAAGLLGRSAGAEATGDGPALLVYSEEDFGGKALLVSGTVLDLPREELEDGSVFDWNDNVRSLRVLSGTWRLCQHGRLNTQLDADALWEIDMAAKPRATGWTCLVSARPGGPAEHRSAAGWGWVAEISSIELVSPEPLPEWATGPLPGR